MGDYNINLLNCNIVKNPSDYVDILHSHACYPTINQSAIKCMHNAYVHVLVYTKFLEAIKSFVYQYNMLLLSFAYLDPALFIH